MWIGLVAFEREGFGAVVGDPYVASPVAHRGVRVCGQARDGDVAVFLNHDAGLGGQAIGKRRDRVQGEGPVLGGEGRCVPGHEVGALFGLGGSDLVGGISETAGERREQEEEGTQKRWREGVVGQSGHPTVQDRTGQATGTLLTSTRMPIKVEKVH